MKFMRLLMPDIWLSVDEWQPSLFHHLINSPFRVAWSKENLCRTGFCWHLPMCLIHLSFSSWTVSPQMGHTPEYEAITTSCFVIFKNSLPIKNENFVWGKRKRWRLKTKSVTLEAEKNAPVIIFLCEIYFTENARRTIMRIQIPVRSSRNMVLKRKSFFKVFRTSTWS